MKFSTTSYAYTSHYYISKSTSLSRLAAILLLGLSYCVTTSTCDKDDAFVDADKKKSCVPFAKLEFGPESPSIFVIEAKGRLGNHLIAYAALRTLQKELGIQPYMLRQTSELLGSYFSGISDNVPLLDDEICDYSQLGFQSYEGGIEDLVEEGSLHKGKLLNLWPFGYKNSEKVCCPTLELQRYVNQHYLTEIREELSFLPKFWSHAQEKRRKASSRLGIPEGEITFVGIHNRRTDYIPYMEGKYGMKSPFNKRYFREAMDYFREEHENPVFFYVSDDMEWGRKNVKNKNGDLFFVGKGDEESDAVGYDLAILASCNHTIMTWGSFSMWAAILSGGEYYTDYGVIVPKEIQEPEKKKRKKNVEL